MQYPVIYDIFFAIFFFIVIASAVIMLAWLTVTLTEEEERSQKIDELARFSDLPAWYLSDAPAHLTVPLLMEALNNA